MNILKHMSWAGDNKVFPEVMDELGIAEIGFDKARYNAEFSRLTPSQAENFKKAYTKVNDDFKKLYPQMTDKDKMKWKYQRYMQDYLGTIKSVDDNVGRLLDYLETNNLMDNTIIVYTSDQDFILVNMAGLTSGLCTIQSFKTPLIIAWPGRVKPGGRSDELVQNLDFAQTFLDAAGIPAPSDMQGESMVPLLTGKGKWTRDAVYYHYYEYPRSIWLTDIMRL